MKVTVALFGIWDEIVPNHQHYLYLDQGCGSGLIQSGYGSGSRNLAQSGYGSGSTMSLNPDPIWIRIRIHDSALDDKVFLRLKNQQRKSNILAVCTIFIHFRYKNK
jgi:hypothetical protein